MKYDVDDLNIVLLTYMEHLLCPFFSVIQEDIVQKKKLN